MSTRFRACQLWRMCGCPNKPLRMVQLVVAMAIAGILFYICAPKNLTTGESQNSFVAKTQLERLASTAAPQLAVQDDAIIGEHLETTYLPTTSTRAPAQLFLSASVFGRLGNLLFQYAAAYGLARRAGKRLHVTEDNALLEAFPAIRNCAYITRNLSNIKQYRFFVDPRPSGFAQEVVDESTKPYNVAMKGFFQSFRYFDDYREDLRAHLRFNDKIQSEASFQMHKVRAKAMKALNTNSSDKVNDLTWIAVHIRRGDILSEYNQLYGYRTATPEYLRKSAAYFVHKYASRYSGVVFVVFSEELDWARANFTASGDSELQKVHVEFMVNKKREVDMQMMILCNATILTVGSFGWWSGYLSGTEVFYYAHPFHPGSPLSQEFDMQHYYLPEWHQST